MHYKDWFVARPCEEGWEAFRDALEAGGLELAVGTSEYTDRLWGARFTHRAELLKLLALDDSPSVRVVVAENTNTRDQILIRLAEDSNGNVRRAVCANVNLVAFLVERGFKSADELLCTPDPEAVEEDVAASAK